MAIELKPDERDAIFRQIKVDLSLFEDLEAALREGDEEDCYKFGRILSDALRLVLDGGLGWRSASGEPTALTLPDEELAEIMGRLKWRMVELYESQRADREATQARWEEIATIRDRCGEVAKEARRRSRS